MQQSTRTEGVVAHHEVRGVERRDGDCKKAKVALE